MVLQVVLTSTDPSELCINGMSFSRRSSKWANAALVVSVSSKDFDALSFSGPLAGVEFQVLLSFFQCSFLITFSSNFIYEKHKLFLCSEIAREKSCHTWWGKFCSSCPNRH